MGNPLATVLSLYSLFPEVSWYHPQILLCPMLLISWAVHPNLTSHTPESDVLYRWQSFFYVFACSTQVQAFKVVIFLFFLLQNLEEGPFLPIPLNDACCSCQLPECLLFIFAPLRFLSALSTLWSTFCFDAGKGFWGYSRIWKHQGSFQVQYIMEILPVQGCCVKQFQTTNFSSWSMWGFCAVHNPHNHTWQPQPNGQDPLRLWCIFYLIHEEGGRGGTGRIAVLL